MSRPIVLTVTRVVRETPDAVTLHFPQPKVHRIWYKPGQYLPLAVVIEGKKYYRSYSICTSPRLDDTIAVTVKRVPGGLVSQYLNAHVREGDLLEGMRPAGRFFVENSVKERRHLWLFGAGSGITPLVSILRSTLYNEPNSRVTLVYQNRDLAHTLFFDLLRELEQRFPDRLQIHWWLSRPAGELPQGMHAGRLHRGHLPTLLGETGSPGPGMGGCFLCGPEGFMEEVEAGLLDSGIGPEMIHKEHFFRDQDLQPELPEGLEDRMVEVQRGEQHYRFLVPAGARILEAGLQQGVPMPYSCRRGECCTCMGLLTAGEARMAKNEALTDEEVARGLLLTCQAYPLSDGVSIQF